MLCLVSYRTRRIPKGHYGVFITRVAPFAPNTYAQMRSFLTIQPSPKSNLRSSPLAKDGHGDKANDHGGQRRKDFVWFGIPKGTVDEVRREELESGVELKNQTRLQYSQRPSPYQDTSRDRIQDPDRQQGRLAVLGEALSNSDTDRNTTNQSV